MRFVINVAKTAKFLLSQAEISQYTVAIVLKKEEEKKGGPVKGDQKDVHSARESKVDLKIKMILQP